MSLSELKTQHHIGEQAQILQSLALAVLEGPNSGFMLPGSHSKFLATKKTNYNYANVLRKSHNYTYSKTEKVIKEYQYFMKNTVRCETTYFEERFFWAQLFHGDHKKAQI